MKSCFVSICVGYSVSLMISSGLVHFFGGFNSVFLFYEHFSSGVYFYSFRDSSVESKGIVILLLLVGGK